MRRSIRLGLAVLAAVLATAAAYTAYWFVAAGQIKEEVGAWAQSVRADKIDASWQKIEVTGFPVAFRVELESAVLRDDALTPSPVFRIPSLAGAARPWGLANWQLSAPAGLSAELAGTGERAPLKA